MFCDLFSKDEMNRLEKKDCKELWDYLPAQLRNRWFLKIDIDGEDEKDIFGFKNLIFEEDNNNRELYRLVDKAGFIRLPA